MPVASLPGQPPPLVGRERELGVLRDHLAAAIRGRGSLVLIGGEAGIGKTALCETICRAAADQGVTVLVGRCFDLVETPAYGPWLYLFERYRPEVALPAAPAVFAERGVVGAVASQAALFRQVLDFLEMLAAHHPVILLLDDLHWADPASLDLLRSLAQSVATMPLLILVTYRSDELTRHHPLYQLLPSLVREADAQRIDLHRLDDTAVRALVVGRYKLTDADIARLVAYLQARAEGNALFLGELLRSLEAAGTLRPVDTEWALAVLTHATLPPLLRQVIDARLGRLDAESRRLLAVAAVIGHEVPLSVWCAVAATDDETVVAVIEHAIASHLLTATGTNAAFVHALIRETLYEAIVPPRRRIWHRRVGEVMAMGANPTPDLVAYHFQQAGDMRAAEWLVASALHAENAHALLTAAQRVEAALAFLERDAHPAERGWLLTYLARLCRYSDPARGVAYLDEAAPLAAAAQDGPLAAYLALRRGLQRCMAGDIRRGIVELAAGVAAMQAVEPQERPPLRGWPSYRPPRAIDWSVPRIDGTGTLVLWLAAVGNLREARTMGERVLADVAQGTMAPPTPSSADGLFGLGRVYAMIGRPDESARALAMAREQYRAMANFTMMQTCSASLLGEVLVLLRTDDIAARRRVLAESDEDAARAANARPLVRAIARLPVLRVSDAWPLVRDVIPAIPLHAGGGNRTKFGPYARWQGEEGLAWSLVRDLLPSGPATEPGDHRFMDAAEMQRLATALALDANDLSTARAWLEAHDRWLAWGGAVVGLADGKLLWARYYGALGDAERAHHHGREALERATEPRQPLALLAARRMLGELDTDAGRYDDATRHLHASLALATACEAPFERALTLLALAGLRAATGDRGDAQRLLDEVTTICTPLGARPTLARADALAARLVATKRPAYPAGLTAREVEVLGLVAAGCTSRAIAETLFLSITTVNNHIAHILAKTDSANRTEAAVFAQRHGLA